MISAEAFSLAGDKYLGRSYYEMDCQAFYEQCAADVGLKKNLGGSNAWYREFRKNGWVGTPEECKAVFGSIPKGATLFIHAYDGGEVKRGYHDGLGNASHIGIKTGRGRGAIHSSHTRDCVAESDFHDKTIPNGGWNTVGLHPWFSYGDKIDSLLKGQGGGGKGMTKALVIAERGNTVNMRANPSKDARVLTEVPVGKLVDLKDEGSEWSLIAYNGREGWMMTMFLVPVAETDPVPPDAPPEEAEPENPYDQEDTAQITMGQVEQLRQIAQDLLEWADGVIGHG